MNPSNEMMDLGFAPALAKFEKLLARRLRRHDAANEGAVRYITNEDAVRYTFFHALTTTAKGLGLKPEDILPETKRDRISRVQYDMHIFRATGSEYLFEFKYDDHLLARKTSKSDQRAGKALRDVFRLAEKHKHSPTTTAVFVYLTTQEMVNYFSDPAHGLTDIIVLVKGANPFHIKHDYLTKRSDILKKLAGPVIPCMIDVIWSYRFQDQRKHELRVYRVRHDSDEAKKSSARGSPPSIRRKTRET